ISEPEVVEAAVEEIEEIAEVEAVEEIVESEVIEEVVEDIEEVVELEAVEEIAEIEEIEEVAEAEAALKPAQVNEVEAEEESPGVKVALAGFSDGGDVEQIDAWELPASTELVSDEALTSVTNDSVEDEGSKEVIDLVSYDEEVTKAKAIQQEAESMAGELLTQARAGKGIEAGKARDVVENMIDSVFNNQDALVSLSRLKDYDNYTFMHSVNVSILTIALGRRLGLSREDLGKLGMGGILHDVGKMLVPDDILNKPGTLTKKEFKEMKNHVTYGVDLLEKSQGITDDSIYVALQHHERIDGSGYPNETPGEELHLFGRIGSICDVYDAMTTVRAYGDTPPPNEALKKMYGWRGQNFDPDLVDTFIMCLGIYPIGGVLELDTGEVAVVKAVNRSDLLRPKVLVYMDAEGQRYFRPFEVDFSGSTDRRIVSALGQYVLPPDLENHIEH
ncbi:MAG: HD-GYP domain-containing protein, partial [Proteobacteria bacterium]|nr:HD-GYP domain-containing protein [Pseudomonadota bacterium]